MARILKGQPLPHAVVCDTSILWFEDKGPIAHPEFEQFWDTAFREFTLELHIPEIVRGELLFQHFSSCHKLFKSTEDNLKRISLITAAPHSTRLSVQQMKAQVETKFDKWLKVKRGSVLPLPASQIDWKRLANDAVWRVSPFLTDAKNPESEKGFRDALILETVCHFVGADTRKINIALLCNDHALRNAAQARLKTDQRFTAYASLKDFETYLRLTKEKFTNEFIAKIVSKARDRFFLRDDPSCLVKRERLIERIEAEHKDYFTDVTKSEKTVVSLLGGGFGATSWTPVGSGRFWIVGPEFLRTELGQRYFWKSIIRYMRLYARSSPSLGVLGGSTLLGGAVSDERVLSLPFHVTWSAMVKNDARFHDLKVEEIRLTDNDFRIPTETEIKTYHLRPEPPPDTTGGTAATS